jgi:hypothetical protein
VVAALGVYTHLTMIFVVVSHAAIVAWLLLSGRAGLRRRWVNPALGFLLAGGLSVALYAPLVSDIVAFKETGPQWQQLASPAWVLRQLTAGPAMAVGAALAAALLVAGCWSYLRQSPTVLGLLMLPLPVSIAAVVVSQRPTFPRFFFFLVGLLLLVVVRGAVTIGAWVARLFPRSRLIRYGVMLIPVGLIAGIAIHSALKLPYGYRYPKQDFKGALRYVEKNADGDDAVAMAGVAARPYQIYYDKPWKRLKGAAELSALRRDHDTVWLVYTFRRYIEKREPELMDEIRASCRPTRSFPGTIPEGTLVVSECT